ncbi:T9SS type A sorting domain-containing protein, partial [Flavobacteriaceae bacterium]|nr:T9SS type A sorting domain-containing protein [Flavobacteriaceae bacterium]
FGFRQSDSSKNEGVLVDNLRIAETFAAVTLTSKVFKTNAFNLYPNPAKNDFITISSNRSGSIQVQVFDILGKQVIDSFVANGRLNISKLNTGMYLVKLTQKAATVTKKLIVQ